MDTKNLKTGLELGLENIDLNYNIRISLINKLECIVDDLKLGYINDSDVDDLYNLIMDWNRFDREYSEVLLNYLREVYVSK